MTRRLLRGMLRVMGMRLAVAGLSIVLTACTASESLTTADPADGQKRSESAPSSTVSPFAFSDCDGLQAGDQVDSELLQCDPDRVTTDTMDCQAGTYIRLLRPGKSNLEAIIGLTPTWKVAEPLDERYGRTTWAFEHCLESD